MQIFAKGNDIETTIELFEDQAMTKPEGVDAYKIDMLLYSYPGTEKLIYASDVNNDKNPVILKKVNANTLSVLIPHSKLDELGTGEVRLELRLKSTDGTSSIIASNSFILEDSQFSNTKY